MAKVLSDEDVGKVLAHRDGHVVVRGRDGEELTRRRPDVGDPFEIAAKLAPPGWKYQWVAQDVIGDKHVVADQNISMKENGWRAVPASRHEEFEAFVNGNFIIRGGQMLVERPKALDDEARREDQAKAHQLIRDRNESLGLETKRNMPPGFSMDTQYRGTRPDVKISIDPALDIPRPNHEMGE